MNRSYLTRRVAAASAAEVAEAPAELDGSPTMPNSKNMSPLSPDASGLPARLPAEFGQLSYSKQYDHLFTTMPLDVKKPVPKPNPVAQQVHTCFLQKYIACVGLLMFPGLLQVSSPKLRADCMPALFVTSTGF